MNRREFGQVLGAEMGAAILGKDIFRGLTNLSSVPGEVIRKGDPDKSQLALTIDDCFLPNEVDKVIEILGKFADQGVRATMFPVGYRVLDRHQSQWHDIASLDFIELGNHSATHRILRSDLLTEEDIRGDIAYHPVMLDQAVGRHVDIHTFRPPGGYVESVVISGANDIGLTVVTWSRSSGAASPYSNPDYSFANVTAATNGDIVLIHCVPNDTARLEEEIEVLLSKGLEMVKVSELLNL